MKKIILISVISLFISIIISPLRGIMFANKPGVILSSLFGFLLYFFFTIICLKKYKKLYSSRNILFAILLGICVLQLPLRIIDFQSTLISLPDFLIHLSGILLGYIGYNQSVKIKWSLFSVGLLICIWMFFGGYSYWNHKLNFGTYTGKIEPVIILNFQFTDEKGELISINDFSGKYTVIDFWFTGCGVCFRKFSQVQSLYDKYKGNPDITIISINARQKDESDAAAFETIKEEGFSFPVYRLDMGDPVLKDMGVNAYPTVLIFDSKSRVIFRGSIENAGSFLDKI